ncbi:hypothetical protein BDV38DRAFT_190318 [Aspergillus pseudotamarii]|uniref:Zn(2)-C6 fungal-type domain-containing protein n=1 Tax=Aspergillus pseudotamarii TaxID=132259 RepID=A0A5N6T5Q6_ASPPS|nr:uncharacterized protein BDV38DRAFT_190318 [Aspergillus pseudotamarii]KAE8141632.1 hypothetical protein BDV38DRAFT_190318 [Aspergillus pseudotamarii]
MGTGHRRTGGRKSRTGCRSCRARHIKCDEAPERCRNCTATGRVCDGYDVHRLPLAKKAGVDATRPAMTLVMAQRPTWPMTSDERRCLAYFQHRTVPMILEFYDSSLWRELVLWMSQSEPVVYHAVIALSAVHQDMERRGMPLLIQEAYNIWNSFALEQLGRAFSCLIKRRMSHDPRLRDVILTCCLLFIMLDLLRGRYDDAFRHLKSGLRILKESTAPKAPISRVPREEAIEPCLVETFYHLGIQSTLFGVETSRLPIDDESKPGGGGSVAFDSLEQARQAFNAPLRAVYQFTGPCMGLSAVEIASHYETLQLKQLAAWSSLSQYMDSFDLFYRRASSALRPKEQRGADMLYLQQLGLAVSLKTCLLGGNTPAYEHYTSDYRKIVVLAERIVKSFPQPPAVSINNGVIPTLYRTAMVCRDYTIRWRAIELLQTWPHREGPFDSNWFLYVALETMKAELLTQYKSQENKHPPGVILTDSRGEELSWNKVLVKIVENQRHTARAMGKGLDDGTSSPLELAGAVKCMTGWACVRGFKAVVRKYNWRKDSAGC